MRAPSLTAAAALLSAALATAALAPGATDAAAPQQPSGNPTVVAVNAAHTLGSVSPGVLGQVYSWEFGGMGSFDARTDQFYPQFIRELQVIHPGSIRFPGGIDSETFQWQRAIGPQALRTDNAYGPTLGPSPSTVGPDEFGQLLDLTGAEGVYTVSFGFGTARQAADLVKYMTGKVGTSTWADLRAQNGHLQPYNVPYWEVGNEEYAALYWRSGTPVSVGGPPGACHQVTTCLYIYGGSTRFTNQAVVGYANRTPSASYSTGAPDQVFYATYAPVTPGSQTVYVGGQPWTEVASLAGAGPAADVYTLDPATGAISFGDGVHGAIPAKGEQVTLTYVSDPHDGFRP
jgi:alpha-N-arabinofuranosidase